MEDSTVKVKKKNKTGPLKSTPGFLKCMRNVYLYFKEEKEKGALNIPINSFIERTAVACGVGRKTLYNYAKKAETEKEKGKKETKISGRFPTSKKREKKCASTVEESPGPSTPLFLKKKGPPPKVARNAMIQTDPRPIISSDNLNVQNNTTDSIGFSNFMITRDQTKIQQIHVVPQPKAREITHVKLEYETGPWSGTTPVKRDLDYFSKNNIWHAVYNLHTTEAQSCNSDLNVARISTCQQQATSDHLTDL